MAAVRGSGPPAGISGWCMCSATAKALSMPPMPTGVSSVNSGRCRPAAIAASTVCSEPHRFGRPSMYSGSSPMLPSCRRPTFPEARSPLPERLCIAVESMLWSNSTHEPAQQPNGRPLRFWPTAPDQALLVVRTTANARGQDITDAHHALELAALHHREVAKPVGQHHVGGLPDCHL